MDEHPEPAEPVQPPARAPELARDRDDSRALLRALGRELEQPMLAMRGEVGRILADEEEGPGSEARREAARSLLGLCDDLLGMTRDWSTARRGDAQAGGATGPQPGD